MTVEVTQENFNIIFDEEINVVEIQYQGVNAALIASLEQQIIDLTAAFNAAIAGAQGALGTLQTAVDALESITNAQAAALTEEAALRLAYDTALGTTTSDAVDELTDSIADVANTAAAAVLAEAVARDAAIASANAIVVSDVAVLALSVDALAVDMGAAQGSIISLDTALATETSVRVAQYDALQADFADTNAAVLQESVARADEDEALAAMITAIDADFTDEINAAVLVESLARASADGVLASNITVVQGNVDAANAAIATEQSVRIAADGSINARYGVKVDVNGHVAGFGLIATANDDVSHSAFVINADEFKIFDGSSDVAPFSVSGGIVSMTNVRVGNLYAATGSIDDLSVLGDLTMSTTGAMRGGKTSYGDTTAGFWIGYDAGAYKFVFGDATKNIAWNGTNLVLTGKVVSSDNIAENAVSAYDVFAYSNASGFTPTAAGLNNYSDLKSDCRLVIDQGTETNTKKLLFDIFLKMERTGGDNDDIRFRVVDITSGSTVIVYSDYVEVFDDERSYRLLLEGTSTATGSRTYRIEVAEYITADGMPRVRSIQWVGWCFKK